MTPEQILEQLRTRLTVEPNVAQQALGIGEWAFNAAVERGVIPAVNLGKGAKRRPVPSWWILRQLGLEGEEKKAAPEGGFLSESGA